MNANDFFWRKVIAPLFVADAGGDAELRQIKQTFYYRTVLSRVFRNRPYTAPLEVHRIKKVLILRLDYSIGHTVIGSVMQKCLKELNPNLQIHLLTATEAAPIVERDPRIDKLFLYRRKQLPSLRLIASLRKEKYDAVFCLSFNSITVDGVMANLVAPRAVKIVRAHSDGWRNDLYRIFFNKQLETGGTAVPLWRQLVSIAEQTFGEKYPEASIAQSLFLDPEREARLQHFLEANHIKAKAYTVLNLSVNPRSFSTSYRQWGYDNLKTFITLFRKTFPVAPLIFSSLPADRLTAEQLLAETGDDKLLMLPPEFGLQETMAMIKYSASVVTPDTAIAHIAATYQRPQVVLCASEAFSNAWIPCSPLAVLLYGAGERGISQITPPEVLNALEQAASKETLLPQLADVNRTGE